MHVNVAPHGRDYVVISPWCEIGGPTTSGAPSPYRKAQALCAARRAEIALRAMGFDLEDQYGASYEVYERGSNWIDVVRYHARVRRHSEKLSA
jgi:hypothetical protein